MGSKSQENLDAILKFVNKYYQQNRNAPSIIEVADGVGVGKTTAYRYLQELSERGLLEYSRGIAAAPKSAKMKTAYVSAPLVGSIQCGCPEEEQEMVEELSLIHIYEAAYLDGANRMQIILHVNIPCILPTVVIMLIMNCGTILSVGFEKVYLLQNALNLDTSQTISTYNYELGLLGGQYSYTTAIGLFNTVVNVVMLTIVNTVSRRVSEISLW